MTRLFDGANVLTNGWAAAGMIAMLATVTVTPSTEGNNAVLRRFQTLSLSDSVQVSQTFTMDADGLNGIEVHPLATAPVAGMIRFTLIESDSDARVVREQVVAAAKLVRSSTYRFSFAPIERSNGRRYRFELSSVPQMPATGVAWEATKGLRFADGGLLINGIARWSDLRFQTSTASRSLVRSLAGESHLPIWARVGALLGLCATWVAGAVVMRQASLRSRRTD